jgi:hypothetical protein
LNFPSNPGITYNRGALIRPRVNNDLGPKTTNATGGAVIKNQTQTISLVAAKRRAQNDGVNGRLSTSVNDLTEAGRAMQVVAMIRHSRQTLNG